MKNMQKMRAKAYNRYFFLASKSPHNSSSFCYNICHVQKGNRATMKKTLQNIIILSMIMILCLPFFRVSAAN